jgi:hypothetical protein
MHNKPISTPQKYGLSYQLDWDNDIAQRHLGPYKPEHMYWQKG